MHLDNNVIHATNEELVGLIKTAQEIIPELADLDLLSTPSLIVTDIDPNKCRVAAYRLTNCIGAYNSGRTLRGVEARWAWKDNQGSWVCCHIHRDSPPYMTTANEQTVRAWIAAAPVIEVEVAASEPTVHRPVAVAASDMTASPREFHAFTHRRRAFVTNAPAAARLDIAHALLSGLNTFARNAYQRHGRLRIAVRDGSRWCCHELTPNGFVDVPRRTRRHAVTYVQAGR